MKKSLIVLMIFSLVMNVLLMIALFGDYELNEKSSEQQKVAEMIPVLLETKEYQRIQKNEEIKAIKQIEISKQKALEVQTGNQSYIFVCSDTECTNLILKEK